MVLPSVIAAVLLGMILMHSTPVATPTTTAVAATVHQSTVPPERSGNANLTSSAAGECAGGDHCDHGIGLHLCMAVMAMMGLLTFVRRYLALPTADTGSTRPRASWLRHRLGRAPPWTTPTLAQLSVLRV